MGLFKPDLYRNLAVGFLVGSGIALWQIAPLLAAEVIPAAYAAEIETVPEQGSGR